MPQFRQLKVKKPYRKRVDWRVDDFRRLIEQKGMRMLWEQAAQCPCGLMLSGGDFDEFSGQYNPDCEACYGRGVIFHSPLEITGWFEDAATNPKRFEVYGSSAAGMGGITTQPEHSPNFLDRITLLDNRMTYNETRVRRKRVERLRWPIIPKTVIIGSEFDDSEEVVIETAALYVRKASETGVIDPDVLEEGVDFDIEDGKIDWSRGESLGTAPTVGQRYSIQYTGRPSYIVFDFPFTFRDTHIKQKYESPEFVQMLRRAVVKLEYLGPPEWPQSGVSTVMSEVGDGQ